MGSLSKRGATMEPIHVFIQGFMWLADHIGASLVRFRFNFKKNNASKFFGSF